MSEQILTVIGALFLLWGLGALANPGFFRQMLGSFTHNPALIYVIGLLNAAVGLFLILNHNYWGTVQEVIVSFFGWAALVRGVIMILSPSTFLHLFKKIWMGSHMKGEALFIILMGAIFVYLSW
jgi:hypothetical protein